MNNKLLLLAFDWYRPWWPWTA